VFARLRSWLPSGATYRRAVPPSEILAACLVVALGAAIQGAVGFGVNLFAAPVLVLINGRLVPGPMILAALVLNVLIVRREPSEGQWEAIRWPLVGMVPGAFAGGVLLRVLDTNRDTLALFFGTLILLAVLLSVSGLHPAPTRRALSVAGMAAGFMGTAVGIGGPPMALMYQHREGSDLRGALGRFFGVSSVVSLAVLAGAGLFGWADVGIAVFLLPGIVAGYVCSGALAARVDGRHVRVAVLSLSAASAMVTIAKALHVLPGS